MDDLPGLFKDPVPSIYIKQFIPLDSFLDGQHQQPALKSRTDGGKAAGGDFLEDRHHKAQRTALITLLGRQVVTVPEVVQDCVVKLFFPFRQFKAFSMHHATNK
ncbi:MAG: hypothetical protein U5R30_14395 [Deltaproteobacteria bacterium]|nr:hypothetical protein [Deltaproteobacteria bacterium]